MSKKFLTAVIAATSFCTFGLLGVYGPTSAVWANDITNDVPVILIDPELLPASVIDEAQAEGETPAHPTPSISDVETILTARSLSALVNRHSGTETAGREAECLAGAVYFESKGEPLDGQLAVAQVIINRAKSGRFPSSICGVVTQRSQFSFIRGGAFPPIARGTKAWKTSVAIAHIAQNDLWDSSVSNALYFHARRVSPGWRMQRIASVGNHIFYR
jgi:N-acetylmuramoyl-L-alanine amidase